MFGVGDLVTGKKGNGTCYTTEYALMVVEETYGSEMLVRILAHEDYHSELKEKYSVINSDGSFKKITLKDFLEKYPNCNIVGETDLKKYIPDYNAEPKEPVNIDEIITPEERKVLLEEMKTLLVEYNYHPTDDGLNAIIDEWATNKAELIKAFKKHPNYNGKFQIVFSMDFDRKADFEKTKEFRDYLRYSSEVEEYFASTRLKKMPGCPFEYRELHSIVEKLKAMITAIEYLENRGIKDTVIEGKTITEIRAERNHFQNYMTEYSAKYHIYGNGEIKSYEDREKENAILLFCDKILGYKERTQQFLTDDMVRVINDFYPEAKAKKGQKLSRIVNKLCKLAGINKLPSYNREFAKFADAVNPLMVKRHTVISIHPVDYYTMSFGNSWASCQTIDKDNQRGMPNSYQGQYSSGTESYMLDETSFIFYTVDSKYEGDDFELQPKINRNMFHFGDEQLVQGRMYPQDCDYGEDNLYDNVRNIVQKVVADIMEKDNLWTIAKGCNACDRVTTSKGTHYKDYLSYDNCNVSTLKGDRTAHKRIKIGHDPICPCCGEEHGWTRSIECEDCYTPHKCAICGETHGLRQIDDRWYCGDHFYYCEYHECYESGEPFYTGSNGYNYCESGADNEFYICVHCGAYIEGDGIPTTDGNRYCDTWCAREEGYVERNGEWVYEEEEEDA